MSFRPLPSYTTVCCYTQNQILRFQGQEYFKAASFIRLRAVSRPVRIHPATNGQLLHLRTGDPCSLLSKSRPFKPSKLFKQPKVFDLSAKANCSFQSTRHLFREAWFAGFGQSDLQCWWSYIDIHQFTGHIGLPVPSYKAEYNTTGNLPSS